MGLQVRQGSGGCTEALAHEVPACWYPRGGAWEGAGLGASVVLTLFCPPTPQPSEFEEEASRKVDDLLESYMGIRDPELGKGPG